MSFAELQLQRERPASVRNDLDLPRRTTAFPSPVDWRDEVLYFLLVDRFSDGQEHGRPLLDRTRLGAARSMPDGSPWRWDAWAESGANRWQGGTLQGVRSKLDYLTGLGVTTLWLSPVFRQRGHLDSYHGYGVQDFLDVDPRVGNRRDLVELVAAAHAAGLRVILDIVFNHSGSNWTYPAGTPGGVDEPSYTTGRYPFGAWRGDAGQPVAAVAGREDGAWPVELQDPECYTRAGAGNLGGGDLDDPAAEHKRTDFLSLRDLRLVPPVLSDVARCYKYWVALTDCDGFRLDTLKHVTLEEARNFCGTIREFAANQGKENFLLVGEVAGGDYAQDRYLDVLERNLTAALDIGEMRLILGGVAKGLVSSPAYFAAFNPGNATMGSHRALGGRHVSVLDDHDHVFGEKVRFSSEAASDHQVAAAVAVQLFTLGIPCLYYGTEQALAGPEPAERQWLPDWKRSDRYLREAMFGPERPRRSGRAGVPLGEEREPALPGFGPFGTAGHHCFDPDHPSYRRIAALAALRRGYPVLRHGRQYERPVASPGGGFAPAAAGGLAAWSRILDDEEALCVVNTHGIERRSGDVLVDAGLSPPGGTMTVVLNTGEVAAGAGFGGSHREGSTVAVRRTADGTAYVEVRELGPSETLVLTTHT
jgi:glycosidase